MEEKKTKISQSKWNAVCLSIDANGVGEIVVLSKNTQIELKKELASKPALHVHTVIRGKQFAFSYQKNFSFKEVEVKNEDLKSDQKEADEAPAAVQAAPCSEAG